MFSMRAILRSARAWGIIDFFCKGIEAFDGRGNALGKSMGFWLGIGLAMNSLVSAQIGRNAFNVVIIVAR